MSDDEEDNDLSIIPLNSPTEDEAGLNSSISSSALRFVLSANEDIQPASHHALSVAYESLKKRYNDLHHQFRSVLRGRAHHSSGSTVSSNRLTVDSSKVTRVASMSKIGAGRLGRNMAGSDVPRTYGEAGTGTLIDTFSVHETERHKQTLSDELEKVQRRNRELEDTVGKLNTEVFRLQQEIKQLKKSNGSPSLSKSGCGDDSSSVLSTRDGVCEEENSDALAAISRELEIALITVRKLKREASQHNETLRGQHSARGPRVLDVAPVEGKRQVPIKRDLDMMQCSDGREEQVATLDIGQLTASASSTSYGLQAVLVTSQVSPNGNMLRGADSSDTNAIAHDALCYDETDGGTIHLLQDASQFVEQTMIKTEQTVPNANELLQYRARGISFQSSNGGLNGLANQNQSDYVLSNSVGVARRSAMVDAIHQQRQPDRYFVDGCNDAAALLGLAASEAPTPREPDARGARAGLLPRNEQHCPVCNDSFILTQMEFEQHVNDCIDRRSAAFNDENLNTMSNESELTTREAIRGRGETGLNEGSRRRGETGLDEGSRETEPRANEAEGGNTLNECEDCGCVFQSTLMYLRHRENHATCKRLSESLSPPLLECEQCGGLLPTEESYRQHLLIHGRLPPSTGSASTMEPVGALGERQCPVCNKLFDATVPQRDVDIHANVHFLAEEFEMVGNRN